MGGLIGEIGSLFGGGKNNSRFEAQGANIQNPADANQYMQALQQSQGGMGQQQNLINALNNQNGIQNQSNVFNQLQGVANGQGPNPAQAMLNQATGNNVANQAALMAGQRGAGSNVGLMARQAAQQGAGLQQNAVGQAANMQAQQSLGALGQMGGLANQQAGNQIGAIGNYNQLAQNQQKMTGDQINAQNNANVAMQSNINNTNQAMAGVNAGNSAKTVGGLMNGVGGAAAGLIGLAKGGYPEHFGQIHALYHGGQAGDFRTGGVVPGEPKVQYDSEKNDTVDAVLSPKEIVLPISVTQSENAPEEAAKFVAAIQKKNGGGKPEKEFKEALKRAIAGRKSA